MVISVYFATSTYIFHKNPFSIKMYLKKCVSIVLLSAGYLLTTAMAVEPLKGVSVLLNTQANYNMYS